MRALTSPSVTQQEKEAANAFGKICFSVLYYIFPVMVKVMMRECVSILLRSQPVHILFDLREEF